MPIIENKKWRNDCEDLTLEEAKQFDCCKDLTDDEIKELLEVLKVFTEIAYSVFAKKKAEEEKQKQQQEIDSYRMAA
jgi:hypothetical protein